MRIITKVDVPEGDGCFFGDGEYDSRWLLNRIVEKGYIPIIKPGKISAGGYGAQVRDEEFDEETYKHRSVCEGFFGALTNWFGSHVPCYLIETTITRIALRVISYALRIILRIIMG